MIEFQSPEEIRDHLRISQQMFADLMGMPLRTYEDKKRNGFKRVDLLAAKFIYSKWSGGEPFDTLLEHLTPYAK